MVIKPWGMGIWDELHRQLDQRIKTTGTSNAYFPLLIPKSFFSQEAAHVEGFAKECAVVTHYRLNFSEDGKELVPDPTAKLEVNVLFFPSISPFHHSGHLIRNR
jgi:prolyl-tRNA synthetase